MSLIDPNGRDWLTIQSLINKLEEEAVRNLKKGWENHDENIRKTELYRGYLQCLARLRKDALNINRE